MRDDERRTGVASDLYDEAYFLHACEGYDEFAATEGAELSRRLAAAWRVAGIAPGMAILDIGCGRGEILRHVAALGARAYGVDYALAAVRMSRRVSDSVLGDHYPVGVYQADAKRLPFADAGFERVLMLDIVEHLYPAELDCALSEAFRLLRPGGRVVVHTAPNIWYDRYAYPLVRAVRRLMGQGADYPRNPREFLVPENAYVHVNEQSLWSLRRYLQRAGFQNLRLWLSSPLQQRQESEVLSVTRRFLFGAPPFRWFFEREIFAVGER